MRRLFEGGTYSSKYGIAVVENVRFNQFYPPIFNFFQLFLAWFSKYKSQNLNDRQCKYQLQNLSFTVEIIVNPMKTGKGSMRWDNNTEKEKD